MLASSFLWRSRGDACDQLLACCQAASRRRVAASLERSIAASILAAIAPPERVPDLQRLVADAAADPWVRIFCQRGLVRLGHRPDVDLERQLLEGDPARPAREGQRPREEACLDELSRLAASGAPEVVARLDREVARLSRALAEPAPDPGPRPGPDAERATRKAWALRAGTLRRERRDLEQRAHVVVNLLLSAPLRSERLEALLRGDPHPLLGAKLEGQLWRQDPERAARWLRDLLARSGSRQGVHALWHLSRHPCPGDLSLLQAATRHPQPCLRYLGLDGLARLTAAEPAFAHTALAAAAHALMDPSALVRARAHGLRARHGEEESVAWLVTASRTGEVRARAEATRWLAAQDPARHFELLTQALLHDQGTLQDYFLPVREEAAYGIARVASDEALTVLVRAALRGTSNTVSGAIEDYLTAIVAWRAGEPLRQELGGDDELAPPATPDAPPLRIYPNLWRRRLHRHLALE